MEQFTLKKLVKRKLDETYVIIYAIKNEVNIKKAEINVIHQKFFALIICYKNIIFIWHFSNN